MLHVYRGGHRIRLCGARHWRGRLGVEALEEIPGRTLLGYIEGDFLSEDEAAAARQVCVWCVHVGVTCGRGAGLICLRHAGLRGERRERGLLSHR